MSVRQLPQLAIAAVAVLTLVGCTAPNMQAAMSEANELASPVSGGAKAELLRDDSQREAAAKLSAELLAAPLTMAGAVQLSISNSPAFQATLAQSWGEIAAARQRGLPGGVLFSFERLREGPDLEIGRLLSFGLFDLITLPQRQAVSRVAGEQARVRLASAVIDQASAARQAWVKAVAASEVEAYAVQVKDAAEASAELARRLQSVGNFTKLQAARQHLFYADATSRLARARQARVSTREELVRQLGLTDAQAAGLKLPERLPELPKAPKEAVEVSRQLAGQRLDARLARLELEAAGRSRGVDLASSLVDAELGVRRDTRFEGNGASSTKRGFELDIRLPLFDWGATRVRSPPPTATRRSRATRRPRPARATRRIGQRSIWPGTNATRWCRCARRFRRRTCFATTACRSAFSSCWPTRASKSQA